METGWFKRLGNMLKGKDNGEEEKGISLDSMAVETLTALQEAEDPGLAKAMYAAGGGLISWAAVLQQRFFQVLEEKESYVADSSALPYPESWIRLALKAQVLRCILAGQEDLVPSIENAFGHLACFQRINPMDVAHLGLVERYRDEVRTHGFSPGGEDETVLSDGTSLREVLKSYARALPTFNRYHGAIGEKKGEYQRELTVFIDQVKGFRSSLGLG